MKSALKFFCVVSMAIHTAIAHDLTVSQDKDYSLCYQHYWNIVLTMFLDKTLTL